MIQACFRPPNKVYGRRVRLSSIVLAIGCAKDTALIGEEDLDGSELRIVIARTERTTDIIALPIDEPYRFTAEPLEAVFDRGDALEVGVFGFTRSALEAAIPSLAGMSDAGLLEVLAPVAGPPAPGRYEPPPPNAILFARVDGEDGVDYERLEWSDARSREGLQFGLALPGAVACPPIDLPMRVYNRSDPGVACVFARDATCEWRSAACPHLEAIFGQAVPAGVPLRESPDRKLSFGSTTCDARSDVGLGETRAWTCGGAVVAAQEQVPSVEGTPWVPGIAAPLVSADLADPHQFAPSTRGLLAAIDTGFGIILRRIAFMGGQAKYQNIESPVLDGITSTRPASTVSSNDGITVLASTDFDARVGVSALQCFATLSGDRQILASPIARAIGTDTIVLDRNIGPFGPTFSWHIAGDPGPEFLMSPAVAEIQPPQIGALERLTRSPDDRVIVVHGSFGTVRLERLSDRFPNDLNWFACALDVPHPAGLVGDIVAGTDRMFALGAGGVIELDAGGAPSRTLGAGPYSGAHRIAVVRGADGSDQIVVWHPSNRTLDHFSAAGAQGSATVSGEIAAVMAGPTVIAVDGHVVVALDLESGVERRIPVPPFSEAGDPIEIAPAAVVEVAGRPLAGFRSGSHTGILDLDRGLSSAVSIPGAEVRALFEDEGQSAVWAVVEGAASSRAELLRTPLLP
jgi:hypothetical protein